jgi:hypothetical protein
MGRRKRWIIGTLIVLVAAAAVAVGSLRPARLGPADGEGLRPDDLDRVRVGMPAPDFTLEDVEGRPVTLSAFRPDKHVILIFYRGHW